MSSVAVMCRGKSLNHLDKIPDVDLYILVNRFGKELEVENIKTRLLSKNIHHVMSRVPDEPTLMIKNNHHSKFNILKVIQPYTKHMGNPNSGNSHMFKVIEGGYYFCGATDPKTQQVITIPASMLEDHHIEYMDNYQKRYPHHYPSSGNAAFAYAALDTGATNIHLIGMDFYENKGNPYYADEPLAGYSPEDNKMMKNSILKIIENFPKKNFFIYTYGNLTINYDNCKIIKLKK